MCKNLTNVQVYLFLEQGVPILAEPHTSPGPWKMRSIVSFLETRRGRPDDDRPPSLPHTTVTGNKERHTNVVCVTEKSQKNCWQVD